MSRAIDMIFDNADWILPIAIVFLFVLGLGGARGCG